jgi:copper chaperone CopZ
MEIKTIKVLGMTCNHCKAAVETGIKNLPGIKEVEVNLQMGQVSISADKLDLPLIKSTVEELGYKFAE